MTEAEQYQSKEALRETTEALERVHAFNVTSLVRKEDLGSNSFEGAVEPATKLKAILNLLPVSALELFPNSELNHIKTATNAVYNAFEKILEFSVDEGDVSNRRATLIGALWNLLQPTFTKLQPFVSYAVARTVDFGTLEQDARGSVQSIQDQTSRLMRELEEQREAAQEILDDVRKTAAEQGVSQEAYHFQQQAELHQKEAEVWRKRTGWWAFALGLFATGTLFLHKFPWIKPENNLEAAQLIVSKVLLFGVVAYMLSLSAKNYLSHRHNEVVNRHRQNALMTYRSLVEAGSTQEARDIILQQAASAIYQQQDTGYVKTSERSNSTITELIPRTSLPLGNPGS